MLARASYGNVFNAHDVLRIKYLSMRETSILTIEADKKKRRENLFNPRPQILKLFKNFNAVPDDNG
jgi:hypothetical protein